MKDRTEYFRAYSRANSAKRAETSKKWKEENRARYNEVQRGHNERRRRALGMKPRGPSEPIPIAVPREPKEKRTMKTKHPINPRAVEKLRERFLKWRANLP